MADVPRRPLHGELQCPIAFYDFCNARFDKIEKNVASISLLINQHLVRDEGRLQRFEKVEKEVSTIKSLVSTQIAQKQGATTLRTTITQRVAFFVTTAIALAALVVSAISVFRVPPVP